MAQHEGTGQVTNLRDIHILLGRLTDDQQTTTTPIVRLADGSHQVIVGIEADSCSGNIRFVGEGTDK